MTAAKTSKTLKAVVGAGQLQDYHKFTLMRWIRTFLARRYRHVPPHTESHKAMHNKMVNQAMKEAGIRDEEERKQLFASTGKFLCQKMGVVNSEVKSNIMKNLRKWKGKCAAAMCTVVLFCILYITLLMFLLCSLGQYVGLKVEARVGKFIICVPWGAVICCAGLPPLYSGSHSSHEIVIVLGITGEEEKSVEERAYVTKGKFQLTSSGGQLLFG